MRFWAPILSVALLAGCAHYQPQPLSPDATAKAFAAHRLDDPGLRSFLEQNLGRAFDDWPKREWNLQELTLAAFYYHPSLAVARAQWLVSQAGLKTAGARPNPSMTVTPGYDSQIPGTYSPWLVSATFDVPIETAGKRGKRIAEAEKIAESARWDFVSSAWQIRGGVRASLLDLKINGQRLELLRSQFATEKQIAESLRQRLDAGEISKADLVAVQIESHKAQLELNDAESKKTEARSHLAQALGVSEAALAGAHFNFDLSAPASPDLTTVEARGVALRSRADILAALADYAAAEADLRLQIAKQYPDLHLGPGYSWNSGSAGDNEWSLGVTLELPIFDQNQGPIAEARARRQLASAKFIELQAKIVGEIDQAVADWRLSVEQLAASRAVIATEEQQQKSLQAQLAAGAVDKLDLLTQQLELNNARLVQIESIAQLQRARGALEDGIQSPLTLPARMIHAAQNGRSNLPSK